MSTINIALSGALAAQAALNATSQNVANVMTKGYTRQGVDLTSLQPLQSGAISAGNGVKVSSLIRYSDDYKNQQLWKASSNLAQYDVGQAYLTQLEQVMGDTGSGLDSGLDGFFTALNAVSVEPTSTPLRQQVITSAEALAERFNSLNQVIANQRASVHLQRTAVVEQINSLSSDIALLNKQIAASNATGVSASGLIDARNLKIDSLSSLVTVQVVNQPDGSNNVSLSSGQPLVVGSIAGNMLASEGVTGDQTVSLSFAKEQFTLATSGLGGQLGGLDDLEQEVLLPMKQSITDMASAIATRVNTQFQAGYATDGSAGAALFSFDASSATGMLKVTSPLTAAQLGFSSDPALPGDSGNLLKVIALAKESVSVASLGSVSLSDAATQLVGRLGMQSQQNKASLSTAQTVRDQAEESWKSTSGVNKDEEAINLVQYQQMYQANMKVISVANDLFDATLSMMN
jgi:flagellar hook-associated protein 1 FlgK